MRTEPTAAAPAGAWFALGVWVAPALVAALFVWIVGDVLWRGAAHLSWDFLTQAPRQSGRAGGIGPILVSTAWIIAICMAVVVPVGLGTAVLLTEFVPARSRAGRLIRTSLDVLGGVPSIVFGLFGNAFFCTYLGLGFSLAAGGLTLACMVLPLFVRTAEESLRGVPVSHRKAAAALALSRSRTLFQVVIPIALPGLVGSLLLGVGRAFAETAALVFTSGYVDRMPKSLLDSGRALSVHIFDLSMNVSGGDGRAYASSLVLIGLLLLVSTAVVLLGKLSIRRQVTQP